jgi:hypothetical protein
MDRLGLQQFAFKPKDMCVPENPADEPAVQEPDPSQPGVLANIFNRDSELRLVADRLVSKAKAGGTRQLQFYATKVRTVLCRKQL